MLWHKPVFLDCPGQARHLVIATEKGEAVETCKEEADIIKDSF